MKDIITNGGYMLLCAFGSLICSIVVGFFISYISSKFSMNIRTKLFNKVEDLGMEEVKAFNPSSLITRTTNDVTQIEMLLGMGLQLLIKAPITAVWAITKILNKNVSWSIITAVAVAILLVTLITISIIVVPKFKIVQKLIDKLNNVTRENLTGIRVVRAFNAEDYQENKFNDVNVTLTKQQMFNQKTFAIMSPMMYLVMYFLTLSIYFVGAYLINDASFASKIGLFGDMIVFSSYAMQVIMSFLMLAMIFMMLPRAQVSAKRINEVLDKKVKIKEGNITSSKEVGTISFKNVSFKYPEAEEYVLKDISFDIKKGETVAFIGSTGSGKSVCINGIIASILMRTRPDEVKLVMVDPKKVELSVYNGVPHLLCPVVTDPKKASVALNKIVAEMERRYEVFEESHTKNIATYNSYIDDKNKNLSDDSKIPRMPYIVVIVDELADLMLVASKDVEASIMRITQMARAAGIHLIIATQRPSTDVITGVVKANIPSRISFAVSSGIDSRTILDSTGAEKLLGKGDMLFLPMGEASPQRIQGAFIADDEIKKIIDYTIEQQKAEYNEAFLNLEANSNMDKSASQKEDMEQVEDDDDELYNDVVTFVVEQQKASASLLQRRFKVGYNRAARIIDLLEERGIIGPTNGSKPREVLVKLDNGDED